MVSHKPTHLRPLSAEEQHQLDLTRDPITGQPRSKVWYGGVRFERMKKYGGGTKHKGRDNKGHMIRDSGTR